MTPHQKANKKVITIAWFALSKTWKKFEMAYKL